MSDHTQGEWKLEPVTKKQAGRAQYMALVAPNGKVFGMFYDPIIAESVVRKLNIFPAMYEALKELVSINSGSSYTDDMQGCSKEEALKNGQLYFDCRDILTQIEEDI